MGYWVSGGVGCLRAERHRNSPPAVVWVCALQLRSESIFNREPMAHATIIIHYSLFIFHWKNLWFFSKRLKFFEKTFKIAFKIVKNFGDFFSFLAKNTLFYPKMGQKPRFFCALCTNFKKNEKILKKVLTKFPLYGIIAMSLDKSDMNIDNWIEKQRL